MHCPTLLLMELLLQLPNLSFNSIVIVFIYT